nr:cation:proton antiporter [Pirellulales bacterium]
MPTFIPADPLYQLALVIVAGIVGGELFALVRLPRVTGWIATGIFLRATAPWHGPLTGLSATTTLEMRPLMNFVLGYIAFTVGAALHFAGLRNAGRRVGLLLLGEAIVTPLVVLAVLWSLGGYIAPGGFSLRAAVLLAAIAIAGAPGTTVLVIQEARARGILTRTLLGSIALIDMVAVGMFVFSADYLAAIAGGGQTWQEASPAALVTVAREFATDLAVGGVATLLALGLMRTIVSPAFLGPTMVAVILGTWGGATGLSASGILACTFAGILVSNLRHDVVRSTEAYLHAIGAILFTAFYTLAGMNIDLSLVTSVAGLVAVFVVARFIGKYAGGYAAMSLAGAPRRVRNSLGLSLIPHGGVAVGLLLMVQTDPRLAGVAETVTAVGLAAITINQLVGPSMLRHAL